MADSKKNSNPQDIPELAPAPLAYLNPDFLNSPDGRILRVLSEYAEPLARFRRERIQDTVVFFGSARFHSRKDAQGALEVLEKPDSVRLDPNVSQPLVPGKRTAGASEQQVKLARAAVEMARYYEDARRLSHLLTQ